MKAAAAILVVEDELAIQALLKHALETAGFEVRLAASAEQARTAIDAELPGLLLLDLMLPGMSGETLARQLRVAPRTRDLPIIMVTARAAETERIRGLELGADDYVTKPFSPRELIARMRAVLRRRAPHLAGEPVTNGPLRLDPAARTVSCDGRPLVLGPTEFALLQYLMTHPNRALSRDQLLDALRGDHRCLEDRTIDVYIRRLRTALGPQGEVLVETVRGVGYRFAAPPA